MVIIVGILEIPMGKGERGKREIVTLEVPINGTEHMMSLDFLHYPSNIYAYCPHRMSTSYVHRM